MSVLCRTTTVIVRRGTLESAYPGGVAGYERDCPNRTFRMDEYLTGVGFMVPGDVRWYVRELEFSAGLRGVVRGRAAEVAVIEPPYGPTTPCDWLSFTSEGDAVYVWLAGTDPGEPAMDSGGLDVDLRLLSAEEFAGMPKSVSEDGRLITILDPESGTVYYAGRAITSDLTNPAPGTDAWFGERLDERRAAHDTAGAVAVCTSWVARRPESATAWNLLGVCALDDGRTDLAVDAFLQATRLNPDYPEALCNLGAALVRDGSPVEGWVVLERATRRYPDDAIAWIALSEAQLAVQDVVAAVESLHAAHRVAIRAGRRDVANEVEARLGRLSGPPHPADEERVDGPPESRTPQVRRVGGSPFFVAAHGIVAEHPELPFDHALALARLVLDHGGGPVPFTGKKAVMPKATVLVLTEAGLAEVEGSSDFTQRVHVRLTVDGRIQELLDAKYAGAIVEPVSVKQRAKWLVSATQAGFDLVAQHLP